jgi:hypothetical protein
VLDVVYNYCVVEVTSDRMAIEAVEVSKKGENDGKTIDRFVITPSGSIEP